MAKKSKTKVKEEKNNVKEEQVVNIEEAIETKEIEEAIETKEVDDTFAVTSVEDILTEDVLNNMVNDMNAEIIMDNILDTFSMPTFVDPSVTLIHEQNPFKKIEIAGRTCYKSEDKITKDSSFEFYKMLISKKHYAMVEHSSLSFVIDCEDNQEEELMDYIQFIEKNDFMKVTVEPNIPRILVSGNIRSILDRKIVDPVYCAMIEKYPEFSYEVSDDSDKEFVDSSYYHIHAKIVDLRKLKDLTKDEFLSHFWFTARFITDRGVSHELVRHRRFSFAQESTRYCNYSKDKFGGHVTYCKPSTYDYWTMDQKDTFNTALSAIDSVYNYLVTEGENKLTPQQARAILPNSLKTEIVVSGPAYEWDHFFKLRSKGTTGAPHPDMKYVADIALTKINKYIRSLKYTNNLIF